MKQGRLRIGSVVTLKKHINGYHQAMVMAVEGVLIDGQIQVQFTVCVPNKRTKTKISKVKLTLHDFLDWGNSS